MKELGIWFIVIYFLSTMGYIASHQCKPSTTESYEAGKAEMYKDAINFKHGAFETDPQTGKPRFHWVETSKNNYLMGKRHVYDDAIYRGLGEYVFDKRTGEVSFQWARPTSLPVGER